jgi:biopolymer transport protein ExbD
MAPVAARCEDEVISTINTTPLVDVMLVLLIIFLITIPVVTHTVPVQLPKETIQPLQTNPESIVIAVNRDGDFFWNEKLVDAPTLLARLKNRVGHDAATGSARSRRPERAL